jgi:hypothetical protein
VKVNSVRDAPTCPVVFTLQKASTSVSGWSGMNGESLWGPVPSFYFLPWVAVANHGRIFRAIRGHDLSVLSFNNSRLVACSRT